MYLIRSDENRLFCEVSRHRHPGVCAFCLLGPSLVLAAQNSTAAQQPPQSAPPLPAPNRTSGQQQDSDQGTQLTLKANVNEVDLVFTVTDRHGHFISDLKESDFALLDDQKAPARSTASPRRPICRFVSVPHRHQHLHPAALPVRTAGGHRLFARHRASVDRQGVRRGF